MSFLDLIFGKSRSKKAEIRPETIIVRKQNEPLQDIETVDDVININKKTSKEEIMVPEIDTQKASSYFAEIERKSEEAVEDALKELPAIVEERIAAHRKEIEAQVREELIQKAKAPYQHDLDLYKQFTTFTTDNYENTELVQPENSRPIANESSADTEDGDLEA